MAGAAAAAAFAAIPRSALSQVTAFKQAVAEAAASDRDLAAFYQATGYKAIWTGKGSRDSQRRQQFLRAVSAAENHGLPSERYSPELIETNIRKVRSERDLGRLEVELSRLFLTYARDVQTGVVAPGRVDSEIKRAVPYRGRQSLLLGFSKSSPSGFFKALPPKTSEYRALMKEKIRLEKVLGSGGWGETVRAKKLQQGSGGNAVVALRNRLIRMGYMKRNAQSGYGQAMVQAVAAFQRDHGLNPDGVAGGGTLKEINRGPEERLAQVMVAMERERWMNFPGGRGDRHVYVNMMDFHTRLYDKGKVSFITRSVVGENRKDKRTPEFSDSMEYMEINPDWTVPRSILARDYLPKLQQNNFAAQYLQMIDASGRVVPRENIDFTQYDEHNFPFDVRQPPGRSNALGTVKFMFPNPHAIYLHDTPQRHLFQREVRDFSSGCIRLHDPHDFAYTLLRRQMKDPEPYFQGILQSRRQTIVPLEEEIPVHLDYRTAFTEPKKKLQHRRDVYGRDRRIWAAMQNTGVALRAVRG